MEPESKLRDLNILYFRALRCWQSYNLASCLSICDELSKELIDTKTPDESPGITEQVARVRQLVWYLKIRCLADDYYINESLLLNETDVDDESQVQVLGSGSRQTNAGLATRATSTATAGTMGRKMTTGGEGGKPEQLRSRTGILTGRMRSVSSRHSSSRAGSSYRPLTTSLTATQTAFSRSTRPLLNYATCSLSSKPLYEYLYNTQAVNNKCPDYRQCLEYLNLVQHSTRRKITKANQLRREDQFLIPLSSDSEGEEQSFLGVFWLIAYGVCYFHLHMNKQAEEYFKQALKLNRRHLDSYAWLVKIYLRANQPVNVLRTCEEGFKWTKDAILLNWMARVQSLMGDLYAANANLRESLKYRPTDIEALANIGYFAFYSDKLEQSLRCFQRIMQLTANQSTESECFNFSQTGNMPHLLNNLAICNFYCGFYHLVMPLFLRALLNSPNKDVTSDIWYNISFVPLSCGFKQLAIACLKLSLKSNSQNEEALNNLGVLKYESLINDDYYIENRQELWGSSQQKPLSDADLSNCDDITARQDLYDEAESHFDRSPEIQPEMLYNMAVIKKRRGQLLASVGFCNRYLEHDSNNYHMHNLLKEIKQLVSCEI